MAIIRSLKFQTYQDLFDYFKEDLNEMQQYAMEMMLDLFFIYCNCRNPYGVENLGKYLTELSDKDPVLSFIKKNGNAFSKDCFDLIVMELSKINNEEVNEKVQIATNKNNLPVYEWAIKQLINRLENNTYKFQNITSQIAVPLKEDDNSSIAIYKRYKTW